MNQKQSVGSLDMRTTWFDSVTSFLLASVLMLASVVGVLFTVWLLTSETGSPERSQPLANVRAASAAGGLRIDVPFDVPTKTEASDLATEPIDQAIDSMTQLASEIVAMPSVENAGAKTSGSGHSGPDHRIGDDETTIDGDDIVPRFERWQIEWTATDAKDYARQIDHFEIEVAAIGGGINGVDGIRSVSTKPIKRRMQNTSDERRLYFLWTQPSVLQRYELAWLEAAGVATRDRSVLKLIPASLENDLAVLELQHALKAGHESVGSIAKTVFQSVATTDGYEFRVVSQRYRVIEE